MSSLYKCSLVFQGQANWLPVGWSKFPDVHSQLFSGGGTWLMSLDYYKSSLFSQKHRPTTAGQSCHRLPILWERSAHTPQLHGQKNTALPLTKRKWLNLWHDALMVSVLRGKQRKTTEEFSSLTNACNRRKALEEGCLVLRTRPLTPIYFHRYWCNCEFLLHL